MKITVNGRMAIARKNVVLECRTEQEFAMSPNQNMEAEIVVILGLHWKKSVARLKTVPVRHFYDFNVLQH